MIGGQHAVLGQGAVAGAQTWDSQARSPFASAPLDRSASSACCPARRSMTACSPSPASFAGLDTSFAVAPVLAAGAIPPLALGRGGLGWSSWLTAPRPRRRDGTEPRFEGSLVTAK
jgi:type VI secretion system protein ImpH